MQELYPCDCVINSSDGSRRIFRDLALRQDLSLILPLPLLAALGVLRLAGCLYLLSRSSQGRRIVTVHPHASSVSVKLLMGGPRTFDSCFAISLRQACQTVSLGLMADWVRQNPFFLLDGR
jgi:hypothetical protein